MAWPCSNSFPQGRGSTPIVFDGLSLYFKVLSCKRHLSPSMTVRRLPSPPRSPSNRKTVSPTPSLSVRLAWHSASAVCPSARSSQRVRLPSIAQSTRLNFRSWRLSTGSRSWHTRCGQTST
uniref:Uncharacterized protein n=1 Tax=Hubei levi-like virus 11 TaxID=1922910 RepID=A0A1L3KIT2_9VIRU|nr:hypothetical protein [Hubei levi-like virus 11]